MAKQRIGGRVVYIRKNGTYKGQTPTPAQTITMSNAPVNISAFTDADAQQLRDDMNDIYDPDVTDAIKLYISDSNPNGDGFSHAQNLNYKLDNGKALNVTEKFIDDNIQAGMHAIGKDTVLTRYCHDDILRSLGVSDYSKLTDAQLQSKLVDTTFKTTSYMSASYDASKNPFRVGVAGGNGREVTLNIRAGKNTKVVFGAKKQAEMVINKGTNFKVVGIRYDGTMAMPRSKGAMPRVVLDIETY